MAARGQVPGVNTCCTVRSTDIQMYLNCHRGQGQGQGCVESQSSWVADWTHTAHLTPQPGHILSPWPLLM
jgi:hypothetical protein